ncbi:MAG TPA: CBS domain-containing protein [Gammaproteobacteria bacterium]|nr:CBS domain-containing protein [Gammaproteobacteria bacterium]
MTVGEYCNREVVVVDGSESVAAAARLMRENHVGDLVIVEESGDGRRLPTGIVTDRDLVVEVLAAGVDPSDLSVRDIVTETACFVREDDSLFDALEVMRRHCVRRIPVVDAERALAGIVTVDDVISLMAEMLDDLASLLERQRERETRLHP